MDRAEVLNQIPKRVRDKLRNERLRTVTAGGYVMEVTYNTNERWPSSNRTAYLKVDHTREGKYLLDPADIAKLCFEIEPYL